MGKDVISFKEKADRLKKELAQHHNDDSFLKCKNMGEILRKNLKVTLLKPMRSLEKIKDNKSFLKTF